MRVKDLFEKGCHYLGLSFSSSILVDSQYKDLVIIPQKKAYYRNVTTIDQYIQNILQTSQSRKVYDEPENPTAYGYYEGTFAQLIREMCDVFNAKVVIRNGVLCFERWDFWNLQSVFTMPNQSSEAPFQDPYGTNASEISSNFYLSFALDTQDTNTYDQYEGTSIQMTLTPNSVGNVKNVLLNGLTEKMLPYALAKRKVDLTDVEKVVNEILDRIGFFIGDLINAINTFGAGTINPIPDDIINDRIGAMLLSSDFTDVQKLLLVENNTTSWYTQQAGTIQCNKVSSDNSRTDHLGATDAFRLAKDFHSASWAMDTLNGGVTYPNQYLTYKDKEVPLCCGDFANLKNNNIIKSFDNKNGRLDSMRWNPHTETAKVDFRIKQVYTINLKQSIIIDGQPM
jgi:hypothetical protein